MNYLATNEEMMKTPFMLFQANNDVYCNMSQESLRGIEQESTLSRAFFSPKNVDTLQKEIIKQVFKKTKGKYLIEKQDETDLQVVMRSMFIQHATYNTMESITDQIIELNFLVVDDVVPGIISQIDAHFGYLDRAFGPLRVIDRPKNVSSTGTRTIPSVTKTIDPDY